VQTVQAQIKARPILGLAFLLPVFIIYFKWRSIKYGTLC
jgi:hypothetical protein